MLGVGFSAARTTISLPLVMPPLMPPALLVAVVPSRREAVVGLRAAQARSGESAAEFDPLDRRDGEQQVGDHAFGRVEEGLSQAEGHALRAAFDDAAHRVAVGRRGMQHLVETFGVGAAADLGQPGREADACGQHLFGHDAAATSATVRRAEKCPPPRGSLNPANLW